VLGVLVTPAEIKNDDSLILDLIWVMPA